MNLSILIFYDTFRTFFFNNYCKIICRNEHIRAIGYDGGQFCVYIRNSGVQLLEINNYLSKYLINASQVEIRAFKKMIVEEYASLQSGDRIVRNDINKFGTLGFVFKEKTVNYCATCRHVTLGCDARKLDVRLLDGSISTAIDKYEPSERLDFAFLKLETTPGSFPVCTGLRNRNNEFVQGQVFLKDEFTLHPHTPVYKWGSTTNLTTGLYKETYEELEEDTEDSYPLITITNDVKGSFGKPGDSGALVCFTGPNSEVAAGLLMGLNQDLPGTFSSCRIADGLSFIENEIPNVNHLFNT